MIPMKFGRSGMSRAHFELSCASSRCSSTSRTATGASAPRARQRETSR